jgi:hypothetical protein
MPLRSIAAGARPPQQPAHARERPERCQVRLVKVRSGVAAGRTRRSGQTVRSEWWTVFQTREQFAACAADDPLRFADPLLFGQFKSEAEDVFQRHGG